MKYLLSLLLMFFSAISVASEEGLGLTGVIDYVNIEESYVVVSDTAYKLSSNFILYQEVGTGQKRLSPTSLKKNKWIRFNIEQQGIKSPLLITDAIILRRKPKDDAFDDELND